MTEDVWQNHVHECVKSVEPKHLKCLSGRMLPYNYKIGYGSKDM